MIKKPIFKSIKNEICIEIIYFISYLLGNTQWLNRIYGLLFMILNAFSVCKIIYVTWLTIILSPIMVEIAYWDLHEQSVIYNL